MVRRCAAVLAPGARTEARTILLKAHADSSAEHAVAALQILHAQLKGGEPAGVSFVNEKPCRPGQSNLGILSPRWRARSAVLHSGGRRLTDQSRAADAWGSRAVAPDPRRAWTARDHTVRGRAGRRIVIAYDHPLGAPGGDSFRPGFSCVNSVGRCHRRIGRLPTITPATTLRKDDGQTNEEEPGDCFFHG